MAEDQLLMPSDMYLKSGIHIGTKFKTKHMEQFIYKTRSDGLSVLNLQKIDKRLAIASRMISNYKPEEILVVGRRENSWRPIKMFAKVVGCNVFAGRYPPGILTNTNLEGYFEPKILVVVDPWPDRNAVNDAIKIGIPIIAMCDTNNNVNNVDLVVPANNKGKRALGTFFYILAREYLKLTGKLTKDELDVAIDDFCEQ